MSVSVAAQYWAPTAPVSAGTGHEVDLGEVRLDAGDAETDNGKLALIVDLDPDPTDPERSFSALRIVGSIEDLRAFVDYLSNGIDINAANFD